MAHGIRGGVNFLLNLLTIFRKRYRFPLKNLGIPYSRVTSTFFLLEKDLYISLLSMDFSEWMLYDLV